MLFRLLQLVCLFAAAAAQQTYYCNSLVGTIRDNDFYLVTRNQNDGFYPPGLSCEFNAVANSVAFLVEIQTFNTQRAVLTIDSLSSILFRASRLAENFEKVIATPNNYLRVRFDATGDYSGSSGVRLRVRAFDRNGCPPDWQYLYGNCFGTSSATGRLNYTNAQKACNSMRSNLLHLPSSYTGSLTSFRNMLYTNLRSYYTWIGLTDRSARFRHTWLNGDRQIPTYEITCYSGGSASSCYSNERCGTFYGTSSSYAIYMDKCSDADDYACSMPPGGTSYFYSVPYMTDSGTIYPPITTYTYVSSGVIWGSIVACVVIGSIIVGAVYGGIRRNQIRRAAGATGVIVSAGRVVVPPPGVQVQVQQSAAVYYPPPQAFQPPPPQANPPPPPYNVAVGAGGYPGNVNMGYAK